jgi:hypothetical protein
LAVLVSGLSAQVSEGRRRAGFPEDWTHHHIKFSAAALRQHPQMAAHEPRAAFQLYREARAAMARFSSSPRVASAVSAADHRDWSVLLGGGRIQFGQFPAKWSDNPFAPVTLANCDTDFVVYGLNVAGSATQANLIGFNNLYSAQSGLALCGLQPTFLFAYNISTVPNGRILTSPVLSLDGTKVAFIETVTTAGSRQTIVHVLNIPTSNPGPGFPEGSSAASPAIPTAMTSLTIAANSDTRSSPWVDYATDTMYVAADTGSLYKITGVFGGTPTLAGSPWPLLINLNSQLTSPVLDVNGNAFMGAGNGRVYSVNVNTPGTVTAIQIGTPGLPSRGVFDTPILDSTASTLLAISSNSTIGVTPAAVVSQIDTNTLTEINRVAIGLGSTTGTAVTLYGGDFDNTYFSTPATGHMLVCGTGALDTTPTLYSLSFDSSAHLLAAAGGAQLSTDITARCGPITEFYNVNTPTTPTDFFFLGVTRNCSLGAPATAIGCVMSLSAAGTPTVAAASAGGASGIIPDNDSVQPNASSIYFTSQGAPNTAYKLTQQGLN